MENRIVPELHITPENYEQYTGAGHRYFNWNGEVRMLNAMPRRTEYGSLAFAPKLEESFPLIPRDEWIERIKEKDANQSWLRNINDLMGVPCTDQNGRGYCHAYGTVGAGMTARAEAGLPTIRLSAESVGGIVTGWINRGANPDDDLEVFVKYGACAQSFMDSEWSLNPTRWKPGWEQDALNHRVVECFDLDPDSDKIFDQEMTCVLINIATADWYNWWGHHIQGPLQAKYMDGKFWLLKRNSWGQDYGDNGYFWMAEGYGRGLGNPDGAFAIRLLTASEV
jgi:hypothetical protein